MQKYSKDTLINDIKTVLIKTAGSVGVIGLTISKEILTFNSLIFSFDQLNQFIIIIDAYVKNILLKLSEVFGNRVFEGSEGFYRFDDIILDSKLDIQNGKLFSIELPFHSIIYKSYFDVIPLDVIAVIINGLDFISIPNLPFNIAEDTYKYLIGLRFPWLVRYLNKLLNDLQSEDKKTYNWKKIYIELIRYNPIECFFEILTRIDLNWISEYLANIFISLFLMIRYPGIYEKFKGKLSVKDFEELYKEAENINKPHKFYDYSQTGIIPPGYTFKFSDIKYKGYCTRLISQMIKEGLKFETKEDYYEFIISSYNHEYDRPLNDPKFIKFLVDINLPIGEIDPLIGYISSKMNVEDYEDMLSLLEHYRDLS